MDEMFTYKRAQERLSRESYTWECAFDSIKNIIDVDSVLVAYPKNLYRKNEENIYLYLFTKFNIYCINVLDDVREFDIRVIRVRNIKEINIKVKNNNSDVIMDICMDKESIKLSSEDDTNEYQSYKYANALFEIAKIYSA